MLRRVLIASAALAMVLVTSFPDYAFARGGVRAGGYRGGAVAVRGPRGGAVAARGYRGGGVLLPRRLRLRRLRQPGLPERVLSVLSGATPFGLWCSKPMVKSSA